MTFRVLLTAVATAIALLISMGPAEAQPSPTKGSITVRALDKTELRARLDRSGWKVLGNPTESKTAGMVGIVYPITRGPQGGAVSIYEYDAPAIAGKFDQQMRAQNAATRREGGKVFVVLIQGDLATSRALLNWLLSDLRSPPPGKGANAGQQAQAEGGANRPSPTTVFQLERSELQARLDASGWKVLGEPNVTSTAGMKGIVFPITRGAKGGAVSIYEYADPAAARRFDQSMRAQHAATRRQGNKVLVSLIQGDKATSTELLAFLLGEGGGAAPKADKPNPAVEAINGDKLRARVKRAGWKILSNPTETQTSEMTGLVLPITRGAQGGAVSIYEFRQLEAAMTFETSMRKQGAGAARSGHKVVTSLIQGNQRLSESLLEQLLRR